MTSILLATAKNVHAKNGWKTKELEWDKFCTVLTKSEEFSDKAASRKRTALIGGPLDNPDTKSRVSNISQRQLITLDYDKIPLNTDVVELADRLDEALNDQFLSFFAHSTFSHTAEAPRVRVFIPLTRGVSAQEYRVLVNWAHELLGEEVFGPIDTTSLEVNRAMFLPSHQAGVEPWHHFSKTGDALDPDEVLEDIEENDADVFAGTQDELNDTALLEAVNANAQGFSQEHISSILKANDPRSLDYHDWHQMGMALWHQFRGSSEGFEMWDEWSRLDPDRYDGEISLRRKWNTFDDEGQASPVTLASMVHKADGWKAIRAKERAERYNRLDGDEYDEFFQSELDAADLPDCDLTDKGLVKSRQRATPNNIRWIAQQLGLVRKFNYLTRREELHLLGEAQVEEDLVLNRVTQAAEDCGINGSTALAVFEQLPRQPYHPAHDWLTSLPKWDGVDRIPKLPLANPSHTICHTYVRKWLIQTVQAAHNWLGNPKPVPHVLVLSGAQGAGKTHWLENISPFGRRGATLHLGKGNDRDNIIAATRGLVVELGELETTFNKSEVGALKNFLTESSDELRLAYARRSALFPRCTSFGASVNMTTFLRDKTGNRRFWVVELDREAGYPPLPTGEEREQLWAQALELWRSGEKYELNSEEEAQHQIVSANATESSAVDDLMQEHFPDGFVIRVAGQDIDGSEDSVYTVTEILEIIGLQKATPATRSEVRQYVENHGGRWGKHRINGIRRANSCVACKGPQPVSNVIRGAFDDLDDEE